MGFAEATELQELAQRVAPVALAGERLLPVRPGLEPVAAGLRRGTVVVVGAAAGVGGATSLALGLLAGPSAAGSWAAAVDVPSLGLVAAAEAGITLERLAVVPDAGAQRLAVLATLLDAVDVVLAGGRFRPADARRLAGRARERGSVLVVLDQGGGWPERAHLRCTVAGARWQGLGAGDGHLRARHLRVLVAGRGTGGRERQVEVAV